MKGFQRGWQARSSEGGQHDIEPMTDEQDGRPAMPQEIEIIIGLMRRTQHNWFRLGVLGECDLMGALERLERLAGDAAPGTGEAVGH